MTCTNCAELKEQLAYYRQIAGEIEDNADLAKVRQVLGVSAQQAKILLALGRAKGRALSRHHLADVCGNASVADIPRVVEVQVCRLRKKLGKDAVKTVWGHGFALGPDGVAALARLQEAA